MSGVWRKTLVYLGLVEEPDEHDDLPEHFGGGYAPEGDDGYDRPAPRPAPRAAEAPAGNVRRLPVPESGTPHVRAMQGSVRVAVLPITAFEEVERVGERYRSGQPVLFDLRDAEPTVARRVLDFVSGVTYALRGRLVPAGSRCFLLVPDGVDIPLDERHRLSDMGYRVPARDA
ncbi:MAG: cell division protein SepF [Actinobacteria bacterium]|nr:cell division protein SepF [Actinomycetota bacterium]